MKTYVFRVDILRDCFVKVKAETLEEVNEKVLIKVKDGFKFSKEFVDVCKWVGDEIDSGKRPGITIIENKRDTMLDYLFTESYIEFLPKEKVFSLEGVAKKVELMRILVNARAARLQEKEGRK